MVRAILEGRKTQTRRVVKPQLIVHPAPWPKGSWEWQAGEMLTRAGYGAAYVHTDADSLERIMPPFCPYGVPGDWLWVKETGWQRPERTPRMMREGADTWERYYYDADGLGDGDHEQFKQWGFKRRPSIHMPRWASRLTLEVVIVRVERLQDISEEDCVAEGLHSYSHHWHDPEYPLPDIAYEPFAGSETRYSCPRQAFRALWDSINAERAPWASNPWVWVLEFKRV
jgi:hypothetical protein